MHTGEKPTGDDYIKFDSSVLQINNGKGKMNAFEIRDGTLSAFLIVAKSASLFFQVQISSCVELSCK